LWRSTIPSFSNTAAFHFFSNFFFLAVICIHICLHKLTLEWGFPSARSSCEIRRLSSW
jgi:hypothetical protein